MLSRWLASEGCPGVARIADGGVAAEREARDEVVAALAGPLDARFRFVEKMMKGDRATWRKRVDRTLQALETPSRDALMRDAQGADAPLMSLDRLDLVEEWARTLAFMEPDVWVMRWVEPGSTWIAS